jgi:putative membrane-bound dehydrogenase-like protein
VQFPLSPEAGEKSFKVAPGFKVELIAAEPHLASPVAMTFDADGRIYVAEMLDYPIIRTPGMFGPFPEGQIRLLQTNDDGKVVKSTVFATGLSAPCSVVPYDGGVLVAAAPDIIFLKDTKGDGHADVRQVILTGFDDSQDLYRVNSLQWGIDGWIYARGVGNTLIHWGDDRQGPALSTEGMNFRFKPPSVSPPEAGGRHRGGFESLSGMSSCFGLTCDDWGRWFFSNSANHVFQIVLPNHYLRRNPFLAAPGLTREISDHGGVTKIYRASPPPAWRVERSESWEREGLIKKYFGNIEASQDYTTSTCGCKIYGENTFPDEYRGNYFVCEACGNLVHRDVLKGEGPLFIASRGEEKGEFLASTDPWCCPVYLETGWDGGLYMVDMYRQMIEHPGPDGGRDVPNVPFEILRKYGMRAGSTMGRIYRIQRSNVSRDSKPHLSKATPGELVSSLDSASAWWRTTAQRLLLETAGRRPEAVDDAAINELLQVAQTSRFGAARVQALLTLEALGKLDSQAIIKALGDTEPGVRENALRLADSRVAANPVLAAAIVNMTGDPNRMVRFQLAFTLGEVKETSRLEALAAIARRDAGDPYVRTAVLSSVGNYGVALYRAVTAPEGTGTRLALAGVADFLGELSQVIGARLDAEEIGQLVTWIESKVQNESAEAAAASLRGLAQGIRRRGKKFFEVPAGREALRAMLAGKNNLVSQAARELATVVSTLTKEERRAAIQTAAATVLDEKKLLAARTDAALFLASGEFASEAPVLGRLLEPSQPEPLQLAALSALDGFDDPGVVNLLAEHWSGFAPELRDKAVEVACGRKNRLEPLLKLIATGAIPAESFDSSRRAQFLSSADRLLQEKARALFADSGGKIDQKKFDQFKRALALKGNAGRGAALFKKTCMTCHKVGREGTEVGPNLASVRDHPREQILKDILFPSMNIQPNYLQYVVETRNGQLYSGLIISSNASSVTLRIPNSPDVSILRKDIAELRNTKVSVMPEGLVDKMTMQEVADLLEFVKGVE